MALSIIEWIRLAAALALFGGFGYALTALLPVRSGRNRHGALVLNVTYSIAIWAVLLAWLHQFRIPLGFISTLSILLVGWLLGWILRRSFGGRAEEKHSSKTGRVSDQLLWWAIFAATVAAGAWSLRNSPVGPGSDSYHHTLITQLIVERGMVPDTYQPYAPLETFSYHYGFHAMAAALAWLTGLDPVRLVPMLAVILMAFAASAAGCCAVALTGRSSAGPICAALVGLVSVFPAGYLSWGRYPQLTGMVVLTAFLIQLCCWLDQEEDRREILALAFLAAGLALVHYRMALLAAIGSAVVVPVFLLFSKCHWTVWRRVSVRLFGAAMAAGFLILPWLWHLLRHRSHGFSIEKGVLKASFYSLDRLGDSALYYPTNGVFSALLLVALLIGVWQHSRVIAAMFAWAGAMLLLSRPLLLPEGAFDTITAIISLYLPGAIAASWLLAEMVDCLSQRRKYLLWPMALGLAGLSFWGMTAKASLIVARDAYVQPEDLAAMNWIRANTQAEAHFMVNTFSWEYDRDWVICSDAGYWIPLLAQRQTVTLPMIYTLERGTTPNMGSRLAALGRLEGRLASPEAVALLRKEGVTHAYVGKLGGPIQAAELEKSAHFRKVFSHRDVSIFELLP